MLETKQWSCEWGGRTLTIEVGRYGLLAQGACTVRYGDTVILATAIKSDSVRDGIDYFPLMVDFEEKLYAAGKIKGSRFMKREGRPSDDAILSARLIDRALRPLFDERIRNDVQVIATALAVDGENDSAVIGLIAASCALAISPIPWNGPIAAARIGRHEDGSFILNVLESEVEEKKSDLDLVVAGTPEKLVMTEAGAREVPEAALFEAMKWGSEQMAPVIELIQKVTKDVGQEKEPLPAAADEVADTVRAFIEANADKLIFDSVKITKKERKAMLDAVKEGVKAHLTEKGFDEVAQKPGLQKIKEFVACVITDRILEKEQRLDGRKLTEIRELKCEIDLLPRVHGSAMFARGDTHVLSIVTLGAPGDVQTLDSMEEEGTKRYMHHYNDAPYSYGETAPLRGPGRRAIGHGALAERAMVSLLPSEVDFPYAMRVVSEVMSANGSSSMASTCASTLALMAAGVPIAKPVAGIAMGLASRENGKKWKVLTDLQDIEDGPGGMDFKIAGTRDGVTAVQMDTKTLGISWDIVEKTLMQASVARREILDAMKATIADPRPELSPYAPRITTIMINPEKIGDVIGPGGKTIKKIIEETGVDIDIEQDGRVLITSVDAAAAEKAAQIVRDLTREVMPGEIFDGTVVRLEDFGAFVQVLPNKDGLVHVSEIAWERTNKPSDVLKLGDKVKVQVKEIDQLGRVNLTMKALVPQPEGYVPPTPRFDGGSRPPRGPRPGGFGGRGGHRDR